MYCMSCIEVAARLHLYLDRELTIEEVVTVQQHLSECPTMRFDITTRWAAAVSSQLISFLSLVQRLLS